MLIIKVDYFMQEICDIKVDKNHLDQLNVLNLILTEITKKCFIFYIKGNMKSRFYGEEEEEEAQATSKSIFKECYRIWGINCSAK